MFEKNQAVKLLLDPDTGGIVAANPAACEFYGYPLETLQAMRIADINLLPADQLQCLRWADTGTFAADLALGFVQSDYEHKFRARKP